MKKLLAFILFGILFQQSLFAQHLELSFSANYLYFPNIYSQEIDKGLRVGYSKSIKKHADPNKIYVLQTQSQSSTCYNYIFNQSNFTSFFSSKAAWNRCKLGIEIGTYQINYHYQFETKRTITQIDTLIKSTNFKFDHQEVLKLVDVEENIKILSINFPLDFVYRYKKWEFMGGAKIFYNLEYSNDILSEFRTNNWEKVESGLSASIGTIRWFKNIGIGVQYSQKVYSDHDYFSDLFNNKTRQFGVSFQYRFDEKKRDLEDEIE